MILFYYGPDEGRLRQSVDALIERYRQKHDVPTNLFLIDATDHEGRHHFENALKHRSFFAETTFIAAQHVFDDDQAARVLVTAIEDHGLSESTDTVILIYQSGTPAGLKKAHKKLFTVLTKRAHEQKEFTLLGDVELRDWMQHICRERGCRIDARVAAALVDRVGNNTWTLQNELAKLCAWSRWPEAIGDARSPLKGDRHIGVIPIDAVQALVTPSDQQTQIFALTDALSSHDKRRALAELQRQLASGTDPHYILSMYAFTVRNLLMVNDLATHNLSPQEIATISGLHPFVVRKSMTAARSYEQSSLVKTYLWLTYADRTTKNGEWDVTDTLYDFILSAL